MRNTGDTGNTLSKRGLLPVLLALALLLTALSGCAKASEKVSVSKQTDPDGGVAFGEAETDGLLLSIPAGACGDMAGIELKVGPADGAPTMPYAKPMGEVFSVETEPTRLNEAATLVYRYDPDTVDDPLLLCLGYFDGAQWHYVQAETKDEAAHTVTFTLYHFSEYYPAQFENELDAAKHYTEQMAARKVLGEEGGDPKAASRAILDYMANKMGVSGNETVMRTLADVAADQDMVKILDEAYKSGGWTESGYRAALNEYCTRVADYMVKNRTGMTADEGAVLTTGEKAMKEIKDLMGAADSGSKFLGALAGGDTDAAAKELLGFIADNTGALGKAMKYTVSGMQNALDVWREDEVEKAFRVYTEGSEGVIFGYGLVDAGDFDTVWEDMGAASRQLCIDRIAEENAARRLAGIEPLNEREEEFYRAKVKEELRSEFERRVALNARIEQEKKNLDLIFERLEADDMLGESTVWYRGFGGAEETLIDRMGRMEHLVQRIYRDLNVDTVYADAPLSRELDGRVSAYSMSEMIRAYFSAGNTAEAEAALQQYYKDNFDLGLRNEDLAGTYTITGMFAGETKTGTMIITPEGSGGTIGFGDHKYNYMFSEGTATFTVDYPPYKEGTTYHAGVRGTYTFDFKESEDGAITGSGTFVGEAYGNDDRIPVVLEYTFVKTE